jgi:hypothetical protein
MGDFIVVPDKKIFDKEKLVPFGVYHNSGYVKIRECRW